MRAAAVSLALRRGIQSETIEGIAAEAGIEGEEAEVRMEMFVGAGHHVSGGARAGNRLGQQSLT